ncbi:hypothetical protein, partial [Acidocella aminolytica]
TARKTAATAKTATGTRKSATTTAVKKPAARKTPAAKKTTTTRRSRKIEEPVLERIVEIIPEPQAEQVSEEIVEFLLPTPEIDNLD